MYLKYKINQITLELGIPTNNFISNNDNSLSLKSNVCSFFIFENKLLSIDLIRFILRKRCSNCRVKKKSVKIVILTDFDSNQNEKDF